MPPLVSARHSPGVSTPVRPVHDCQGHTDALTPRAGTYNGHGIGAKPGLHAWRIGTAHMQQDSVSVP